MKAIFIDCNDQLAPVWASVVRPDDPPIDVNRKAFAREDLPSVIRGYDIASDDHSYIRRLWWHSAPNSSTSCSSVPALPAT